MSRDTLFSDEIVQITEFKKHAKSYADRARTRPLTIAQGGVADLALLRRELVSSALVRQEHYANALDLLMHQAHGTPLRLLSWIVDLNDDERSQFVSEYASAVQRAEALGTASAWEAVNDVLEDWTATAEAVQDQDLLDAVERQRDTPARVSRPSSGGGRRRG